MAKVWVFLQRDLLIEWSSRFPFLLQLLNITLTVTSYLFLSRLVEQESLARWAPGQEGYFSFALIGMAMNGAMLTSLTGLSRSLQLQQPSGTLKPLLFGCTRSEGVLFFSSLYPLMRAGVDLTIYLLIGWAFGGVSLIRANVPAAAVTAGLAIVAFGGLGLLAAAATLLFKCGTPLLWVIASSSWLLGGVLYPSPLLPGPLRWAAQLFPFTHAVQGVRAALLVGAPLSDLLVPILVLSAFTLIVIPLGVLTFNIGLSRARVRGTLAEC